MRFPLILAHGQGALLLANSIVALAVVMGISSLAFAFRKKEEAISLSGIVCSVLALLLAALDLRFGFADGFTLMAIARVVPVPLGILGGAFSLRKKEADPDRQRTTRGM